VNGCTAPQEQVCKIQVASKILVCDCVEVRGRKHPKLVTCHCRLGALNLTQLFRLSPPRRLAESCPSPSWRLQAILARPRSSKSQDSSDKLRGWLPPQPAPLPCLQLDTWRLLLPPCRPNLDTTVQTFTVEAASGAVGPAHQGKYGGPKPTGPPSRVSSCREALVKGPVTPGDAPAG